MVDVTTLLNMTAPKVEPVTKQDNEEIRQSLNWLAWQILNDPRLHHTGEPHYREKLAQLLLLNSGVTGIAMDQLFDDGLRQLSNHPGFEAGKPKPLNAIALALTNPDLMSLEEMWTRYFETKKFHEGWPGMVRSNHRKAAFKQGQILARTVTQGRRVVPEPMHPHDGYFYCDRTDPLPDPVAERRLREHLSSPFYLFHAQAWGRREYAKWLHGYGATSCIFSGLSTNQLTKDNPRDGSGKAYLYLAARYLRDRIGAPYVVLPVPGAGDHAHRLPDRFPDLFSTGGGAPIGKVRKLLAEEFELVGETYDRQRDY